MRYIVPIFCLLCSLLTLQHTHAQPLVYQWETATSITNARQEPYPLAWAGGLNAVQYNTLDLNLDGTLDLVLFDRTSYQIIPLLAEGNRYRFAPEYISRFPRIEAWLVLADYNCDGKVDIFTHTNTGVTVYTNTSENGKLRFSPFGIPETKGLSGFQIPLRVDVTDVPAITDVDNDGDLDLLTFLTPNVGGTVEFNKNLSMERFGHCDSLVFERETARWGGFEEAGNCRTYTFDNARIEHAGSSILAIDLDADQDKDLIIGEILCSNLVQMTNVGTPNEAIFTSAAFEYPTERPVNLHIFPAAYYHDVTFDGKRDLLVSPNIDFNEGFLSDFQQSSILYENTHEDNAPSFSFVQSNFLQEQMLDFGEGALPELADFDGDGDADLFVGSTGQQRGNGSFWATVAYFENIGGNTSPQFVLRDEDFLGLSTLQHVELRPQWIDIDADGDLDFALSSRKDGQQTELSYLPNEAGQWMLSNRTIVSIDGMRVLEKPLFFDFDDDGDADVLLGKLSGALELHQNDGNGNFTRVSAGLGGITDDFFAQRLCPALADVNQDGATDLVTGSRSGQIRVYLSIKQQPFDNWEASTFQLFNPLTQTAEENAFFGRGICPSAFQQHLVVGTLGGGVHLFRQTESIVSSLPSDSPPSLVRVFPNPVQQLLYIENTKATRATLFTTDGKTVGEWHLIPQKTASLTLGHLPKGVYILRIESNSRIETQKIMIN